MRALILIIFLIPISAGAESFGYADIEARHKGQVLSEPAHQKILIQGECLAGINRLNAFEGEYDPIGEWLRVRTTQLLQLHGPCEVLLMVETAREILNRERSETASKNASSNG